MKLMHGDCLEEMKKIPDGLIDFCLTDPPYGTTACKWDSVIPFKPMWGQLKRVMNPLGAVALFGSEPFSSALRMSNINMYKYDFIWHKSKAPNFHQAKNSPLKNNELISVFSDGVVGHGCQTLNRMAYFPQGLNYAPKPWKARNPRRGKDKDAHNLSRKSDTVDRLQTESDYPGSVLKFGSVHNPEYHPTQKPLDLLEYLIRTYTLECETVLDFSMGSGSTGVACKNQNREFIGIEKDEKYFKIALERIERTEVNLEMFR